MSERILVIGAGFAGMWSALSAVRMLDSIGRTDVEVALIAPKAELHVRPRLYERDPQAMKAPLNEVFNTVGVRFIQGFVEHIDTNHKQVIVSSTEEKSEIVVSYDRLILAAGSRLHAPALPGLATHAFNVDQIEGAADLARHIGTLSQMPDSPARNTVVVAGAGFTGLETATEMPDRLREVLGSETDLQVILVERENVLGPDLGPGPRPVITQALRELGVSWRLGCGIASVDQEGVTLADGERIQAKTVVWTGGARANPLTAQIQAERDAFGRLHVDRELKVIGQDAVYASGDCAYAATDDEGNFAKMSCQHAMNLGRSAGHNAAADLVGEAPIPYSQPKYVTCLDLGPWGAVYTEGWDRQVVLSGAEAKALKRQINTEWIYPPMGTRTEIFELSDPRRIVVA